MQKINFADKYGLTSAVLSGKKTMTRRVVKNPDIVKLLEEYEMADALNSKATYLKMLALKVARYKVDEVVAVAQSYTEALKEYIRMDDYNGWGALIGSVENGCPGYYNKMFVQADLMPHLIKITDVHFERLQSISEDDVFKEGFIRHPMNNGWGNEAWHWEAVLVYYDRLGRTKSIQSRNPVGAFASLIDRPGVGRRGLWEDNPWVFAYSFELVR